MCCQIIWVSWLGHFVEISPVALSAVFSLFSRDQVEAFFDVSAISDSQKSVANGHRI
jgi:hypothetical protein